MTSMAIEYSVEPFATATADAAAIDAILDTLERDPVALGPAVSFDVERDRVAAIFQVELNDWDSDPDVATKLAVTAFDKALVAAKLDARTTGVSVVQGDPEQLP